LSHFKKYLSGILVTILLALLANLLSCLIPYNLISASVIAMLLGMLLNPLAAKFTNLNYGFEFTAKKLLRVAIILMGASLSFKQVLEVGKFSLFVMTFTLITAFGGGHLLGRVLKMNWRLSSLISAGTGICGGSAVAAIAPVIEAEDTDIAYAISATFIFDIIMVVLFPIMGRYFGMSDLGFGLWTGTAVNDTSSVMAAGYAFSDAAGHYAVIVKLTRTLSIIPVVLMFSLINQHLKAKDNLSSEVSVTEEDYSKVKIELSKIFPWFILGFLALVIIRSVGLISNSLSSNLGSISKFLMVMSLGAIGFRTNAKKLAKSGFIPMLHGFIISALVVIVSFGVQLLLGQI